jgi:adenosylmethionine-8-amino-7-oxononanoate aminotransferase
MINKPDIICLSKGLTGGFMPLGLTVCSQKIYEVFYNDNKLKALYHGHSYTGNPIACAAACASLELFEIENTLDKIKQISVHHANFINKIKQLPGVANARNKGTIMAIDIKTNEKKSYFHTLRDELYDYFITRKLLLRPLGNTVYMVPPYCITRQDLQKGYDAIENFLQEHQF